MTTATAPHEIPCPDCPHVSEGKSVTGAKSRLRAHQKREHAPILSDAEVLKAKEVLRTEGELPEDVILPLEDIEPLISMEKAAPGPQVIDAGSGPRDGGSESGSEPVVEVKVSTTETTTVKAEWNSPTTGQLLDGLYKVDKLAVLVWIKQTFGNERTLKAAIYDAGLGSATPPLVSQ